MNLSIAVTCSVKGSRKLKRCVEGECTLHRWSRDYQKYVIVADYSIPAILKTYSRW